MANQPFHTSVDLFSGPANTNVRRSLSGRVLPRVRHRVSSSVASQPYRATEEGGGYLGNGRDVSIPFADNDRMTVTLSAGVINVYRNAPGTVPPTRLGTWCSRSS